MRRKTVYSSVPVMSETYEGQYTCKFIYFFKKNTLEEEENVSTTKIKSF